MNKPIRTMSIFCMALFMALLLNATYLQYLQADELNSHNANKRVRDAEFSRERGAILVSGTSVARSEPVDDEFEFQRTYPQPQKYSHLTGYYSYTYGRNAVELTHNEILSGSDPRLFVNRVVDLFGNSEPEGGDVTLTIDPRAQSAAYDGLRALGNNVEGAVVALDPSTGGILAMVSSPSYDPNRLASHNLGRVQDSWEQLQDHPGEPMLNRTIQDVYPPGSTFKLVTAAAALSSGQYTPESTVPGGFQLEFPAGEPIPNDGGGNCGGQRISLTQALMVSCNVSFGHIGVQLGADTLQEQAQKFGFGERYLEDLNGQVASRFPEELEEDVFVAQSAIGQFDVAATPLQMAMVTAGIANGGTVMKPYLVDEVRSPDLEPLEKTTPEPFRTAVSADVARDLTQMMIEVVDQGTATPAQIPGMKVAGKTGTAQSSPSRPPYAWFVSFAPADNPQVAVAVLVEDAGVERDAISGSGLAAPIAKRVMEAVINR